MSMDLVDSHTLNYFLSRQDSAVSFMHPWHMCLYKLMYWEMHTFFTQAVILRKCISWLYVYNCSNHRNTTRWCSPIYFCLKNSSSNQLLPLSDTSNAVQLIQYYTTLCNSFDNSSPYNSFYPFRMAITTSPRIKTATILWLTVMCKVELSSGQNKIKIHAIASIHTGRPVPGWTFLMDGAGKSFFSMLSTSTAFKELTSDEASELEFVDSCE